MHSHSIDLERDELFPLEEECRRRLSRAPSPTTLWRWRTKGVRISGQTIKLACVRVGGTWYTTRRAFAEFLRRQTEAAVAERGDDEPRRRSEVTTRRLRDAGLLQESTPRAALSQRSTHAARRPTEANEEE